MFGKLSLEQRKALQNLLAQSSMMFTVPSRIQFLQDAALNPLITRLPLSEDIAIFAGALVRECERLGAPPALKNRFATVLLAEALIQEFGGQDEVPELLEEIIGLYEGVRAIKGLKILFLASNPTQWGKLSLDEEFEAISQALQKAKDSEPRLKVHLQKHDRVKDEEIISLIQNYQPHILHFAGHGDLNPPSDAPSAVGKWRGLYVKKAHGYLEIPNAAKPSGIILETSDNMARLLPSSVLQEIFADPQTAKSIRLVFLNACWAEGQAELLVEKAGVPFAIGMKSPVDDKAAVRFAQGFYQTLFNRTYSIRSAFDSGKNQIVAVLDKEHKEPPILKVRGGLAAETYHIFDTL